LSISSRVRGVSAAVSCAGLILKPLAAVVFTITGVAPVIDTRSE
jgi:hypothetical protein